MVNLIFEQAKSLSLLRLVGTSRALVQQINRVGFG